MFRIVRFAVISVLLAVTGVAAAGSASAHDELLATTPVADGAVDTAPASVSLTFNEAPVARFSTIHVTGPDGQRRDDGAVQLSGAVVTQQLKGTQPAGKYVVDWRVVSDDGHPITGQFSFDVNRGTAQAVLSATPSAIEAVASASASPAGKTEGSSRNTGLIIGVVAVAVAAIAGGVAGITWRRRRSSVHE
jgi:methionine-rich copper-binding protein CopC